MPTYNYYCENCNLQFSYFQQMSEIPISKCENCNGNISRMITGGAGLIFKGSGFYSTDYKNVKKPSKEKLKSDKNKSVNNKNITNNKSNVEKKREKNIDE